MYGAHIDTLNVYISTGASITNTTQQQWDRIGTQGNQWNYAQINIPATNSYKVRNSIMFKPCPGLR